MNSSWVILELGHFQSFHFNFINPFVQRRINVHWWMSIKSFSFLRKTCYFLAKQTLLFYAHGVNFLYCNGTVLNDNESNAVLVLPISTLSIHMCEDEYPLKMSLTERKSYFSMRSAHGVYFLYYKERVAMK